MFGVKWCLCESLEGIDVSRALVAFFKSRRIVSWHHLNEVFVVSLDNVNQSDIVLVQARLDADPLSSRWSLQLCLVFEDFRHFVEGELVHLLIAEVQAFDGFSHMLKFVGFNENTILEVVDVGCREDCKRLTNTRVLNLLVQEGHSSHFLLAFFDPNLPELGILDGREGAPVLVAIIVHIIDNLVGVFLVNGSLVGIVFGVMMAPKFLLFAHDLLLL